MIRDKLADLREEGGEIVYEIGFPSCYYIVCSLYRQEVSLGIDKGTCRSYFLLFLHNLCGAVQPH